MKMRKENTVSIHIPFCLTLSIIPIDLFIELKFPNLPRHNENKKKSSTHSKKNWLSTKNLLKYRQIRLPIETEKYT